MAKGDENVSETGLSNLAHAIRRSTAVYVAMSITPPESAIEDMLANADVIAAWIGGKAAQKEAEQTEEPGKAPLGVPFGERDDYSA